MTTSPDMVDWSKAHFDLPCVVIGGMTPERAAPLVARGADMVAAISSVFADRRESAMVSLFER